MDQRKYYYGNKKKATEQVATIGGTKYYTGSKRKFRMKNSPY
jgi:hypothetical protein